MVTRDFHFREDDWRKLDESAVQDTEWVPHPDVTLDHPVAEYRALLDTWLKARRGGPGPKVAVYTDAPEYIDWPMLEMPLVEEASLVGQPPTKVRMWDIVTRREARAKGLKFIEWQRPRQSTLKGDYHLLATGRLLDGL